MEQNGIKVNLDNAGSKTRLMYICVYIYIYIIECKNWGFVEQVMRLKWYVS